MSDKTALGDRMKEYEAVTRMTLPRRCYTIIRVDGRAFHTLLRFADKPFDAIVSDTMEAVATALCREASGSAFAYTQSDEASVLLTDFAGVHSQPWLGGNVQKIASISAAIATAEFGALWPPPGLRVPERLASEMAHRAALTGTKVKVLRPQFDARVFMITTAPEAANYFLWRQQDATRNSISMAAQAHFPHGELQGKDGNEMQEMLWQRKGVNWNDYPARHKRGSVVTRVPEPGTVTFTDKRSNEERTAEVLRTPWRPAPAPRFVTEPGSWLAKLIPPLPAL